MGNAFRPPSFRGIQCVGFDCRKLLQPEFMATAEPPSRAFREDLCFGIEGAATARESADPVLRQSVPSGIAFVPKRERLWKILPRIVLKIARAEGLRRISANLFIASAVGV